MNYRYLIFILPFLIACGNSREKKESGTIDEINELNVHSVASDSVLHDILQQIPSPLEMSVLVKESGAGYNKDMLNDPESYSKYNNSFEQALNLGIYGADLGYSNLYRENQQCILYIGAVKELADELRIDRYFNLKLIDRLVNQSNLDSLLYISTQSFNQVNEYFLAQQQPGLSILLLVGGWIEALHITGNVATVASDSKLLIDKIGEQKIVLDRILKLMDYLKDTDENFSRLNTKLLELQHIYDQVIIEHVYGEPTYEEVNGVLVTKDNSISTVTIDDNTFSDIKSKVNEIRSEIVS